MYYAALVAMQPATKAPDLRSVYGSLALHLQAIGIEIHKLPVNVVWLCLEKGPTVEDPQGGPMLPGQSAVKFPARCDFLFYHRMGTGGHEIRTKSFQSFRARGRDGGVLADPLGVLTYRELVEILDAADAGTQVPASTPIVATNGAAHSAQRRVVSASPSTTRRL